MTEPRDHMRRVLHIPGSRWSRPLMLTQLRDLEIEHARKCAMIIWPRSSDRYRLYSLHSKEPAAGLKSSLSTLKSRRRRGTLYLGRWVVATPRNISCQMRLMRQSDLPRWHWERDLSNTAKRSKSCFSSVQGNG